MTLIVDLAERMALIGLTAFVLLRVRAFRRLLAGTGRPRDRWVLALVFGLIAISGTYTGIPTNGAIANSRVVGTAVGGLLGGPWVGFVSGLLAGGHRFLLGGFTGLSCGISTLVGGLLAGWIHRRAGEARLDWRVGFATGFVAELLQMAIILLISRPFAEAWALVKVIAIPMTLVNAAGIALFVLIIREAVNGEDRIASFHTHKVLEIARATLPYLRRGLDEQSAGRVADIIYKHTGAAAVALTDRNRVLAHVGAGSDHHRPGDPIRTAATRQALSAGEVQLATNREEIGCEYGRCDLASGLIMPLYVSGEVVGVLKIYQDRRMTPVFVELATGMAGLFSTQLQLAELEKRAQMATRAELKALRAQINPHFLFNALNTISSFVRTNPEGARDLLASLSEFFRRTLRSSEELVCVAEELELVDCYLAIERARFGERLRVEIDVSSALLRHRIPPFTLQTLVENAVKYGLMPKAAGGTVRITGRLEDGTIILAVTDDGVGMSQDTAEAALAGRAPSHSTGIGLMNINERLKGYFGPDAALQIRTPRGGGTVVSMHLPVSAPVGSPQVLGKEA
ncbi:MAG TPA: sensor histidine kinase [Symbiobacteriaceae bacterium]|nr:sensor histidine kinase [Symbiobacteriaceae bacterium]